MNIASLELCKELHELSGWDVGVQYAYSFSPSKMPSGEVINRWYVRKNKRMTGVKRIPAYDLGYLLRKLPAAITPAVDNKRVALKDMNTYFLFVQRTPDNYVASYNIIGNTLKFLYFKHGDTPEDATCKLCIELWKQGILK